MPTLPRPVSLSTYARIAFSLLASVAASAGFAQTAPFSAERMWGLDRLGEPTLSPDGAPGRGPGHALRRAGKQRPYGPVARIHGRRAAPRRASSRATRQRTPSPPSAPTANGSPSSPGAVKTSRTRSTSSPPTAARRGGSPDVPTGAGRAEVVSGQPAHRLRELRLAGPRALGGPGRPHAGAAGAEDDGAGVGPRADRRTGITSSTSASRICSPSIVDGGEPLAITRLSGYALPRSDVGRLQLRHLAGRSRSRLRGERRQERRGPELRRHHCCPPAAASRRRT